MSAVIRYCLFAAAFFEIAVGSQPLGLPTFHAQSSVSHIVKFNDTYFIGSTNYIYHVDAAFNTLQTLRIGPNGGQDNNVTLLLASPDSDKPVIFWCGSIQLGLCHVNMIDNLNSGDFLNENFYTSHLEEFYSNQSQSPNREQRKLLEYGVYGHLGSKAGANAMFVDISSSEELRRRAKGNHVILASAVYDGRYNRSLPNFGYYSLLKVNGTRNYYIKPTVFNPNKIKFSYLAVLGAHIHNYPIYHKSMFEHGAYVYMVVVQRSSAVGEAPFETRLARFNKTDARFVSYIETPINCTSNNHNYNIAVDAELGDATDDILGHFEFDSSSNRKVLYFLQGESSSHSTPSPTTNAAVVCALPLAIIDSYLEKEMRRCYRGKGMLVEWYYDEREKPCRPTVC